MNINIGLTLGLLATTITVSLTARAADDWYMGIGSGWAYNQNLDSFGLDTDKSAIALSLFGGYSFNENFSAEFGYLYAGKGGVDGVDFETQGVALSGIARLPINDTFSVFAEGGAYLNHVTGNGNSDNGTAPLIGAGMSARLTELIDLQARYRYIWSLGNQQETWETDMSSITLELVIHPNRTYLVAPVPAPVIP